MRLLLVEDDQTLRTTLVESLMAEGFQTVAASGAQEAWELAWSEQFDVVILDVMLPEGADAGFDWARQFRESGFRQPILFLTARESLDDRVAGLAVGEDYLTKPFAPSELTARIKSLGRRGDIRSSKVQWQGVTLLTDEKQVRLDDLPVRLTAKEYEVIELLMLNPGRVFAREEILERIWGLGFDTPSNLVDVYVKTIRKKLGSGLIETVRGVGYRFPG